MKNATRKHYLQRIFFLTVLLIPSPLRARPSVCLCSQPHSALPSTFLALLFARLRAFAFLLAQRAPLFRGFTAYLGHFFHFVVWRKKKNGKQYKTTQNSCVPHGSVEIFFTVWLCFLKSTLLSFFLFLETLEASYTRCRNIFILFFHTQSAER